MIIKGKSRSGPLSLAAHLGNAETNEKISLIETRGTIADDLRGALVEMDAYAAGTRCEKPLYHAAISPEPPHRLTPEQRGEAIDALEAKLGLTGHSRVVVMHEKKDREHIHVVWSRIDLEKNRSVSDSHNYRKHEEVARDLERRFGHDRVQGAHVERDGPDGEKVPRPDRTPSRAELRQEERTGITGKEVKAEVTAAFRSADTADAFKSALEDMGYILGQGDRRDFVVVDRAGGIHSLARRIDGIKAAELRAFMKPIDRERLPSAEIAREAQLDRAAGRPSAFDERQWDDNLARAAIDKDKQQQADSRDEAKRFRDNLIKLEAENKRQRDARQRARDDAGVGKNYGRGQDYVSQSQAAAKDHRERIDARAANPKPQHPDDHKRNSVEGRFEVAATLATNPNEPSVIILPPPEWMNDRAMGAADPRKDHNKAAETKHANMETLLYGGHGHEKSAQHDEAVRREQEDKDRKAREAEARGPKDPAMGEPKPAKGHREFREGLNERIRRYIEDDEDKERSEGGDDYEPDRQHKAPGRGRTRSR